MESGIVHPRMTYSAELIAVAAAVTLPTLVIAVAHFCDVDFGGDLSHFLFLCLVGIQTVLYRLLPVPRRHRTVFFTTMALMLVYVAALAVALVAGIYPLWVLVLPLSAPVVYVTVRAIVKSKKRKGK
jgi:hypothetical protein